MTFLFSSLFACAFNASTEVADSAAPPGPQTDPQTSETTETTSIDPLDVDDDGDGYTENEGDCNDDNAARYPGLTDLCDGIDNDCDDEIDEDAYIDDWNEPDDANTVIELTSPTKDYEQRVEGLLYSDEDVDTYSFEMPDGLDIFRLTVELSYVPDDATYRLTVEHRDINGLVQTAQGSDEISVVFEDRIPAPGCTMALAAEIAASRALIELPCDRTSLASCRARTASRRL